MGRVKKTAIAKTVEIEKVESPKFYPLASRDMIIIDIEIPEGSNAKATITPDYNAVPLGCICKVVEHFHAGDEAMAEVVLRDAMSALQKRARYIRPPERIIIRDRGKRLPELTSKLNPMEAVDIWIEKRMNRQKEVGKKEVRSVVEKYLRAVIEYQTERMLPASIQLEGLAVTNFMPFRGEQITDRIPSGLVGIVGKYEGQAGRSNRAGKSAFLDAILYSLFGECRSVKTGEELIHSGMDHLFTELKVGVDGKSLSIARTLVDGKSKVQLNGNDVKVTEANKEVERRIGMTFEDFIRTCFVRQGDLEGILNQSSAKLKEDIIRWRGLEIWPKADAIAQQDEKLILEQIAKLEAQVATAKDRLAAGCVGEGEIEEQKRIIAKAERENEEMTSARSKVVELKAKLELALLAKTAEETLEKLPLYQSAEEVNRESLAVVQKKIGVLVAKDGIASKEFEMCRKNCKSGFEGACPIDSKDCPRTDEINADITGMQKRFEKAKAECDKIRLELNPLNARRMELESARAMIQANIKNVELAKRSLVKYQGEPYEVVQAEYKNAQLRFTGQVVDLRGLKEELVGMLVDAKSYVEAESKLGELVILLGKIRKNLSVIRYARFMLGKFGIPSMLIENALVEIEVGVNSILERLETDHRLHFDSERELKKLAKVCYSCGYVFGDSAKVKVCPECNENRENERADELRPMIIEGGEKHSFGQDSGAGRALVALATRIAMSKFLGAKILFLDEVTGSLDAYNLDVIIKLLQVLPEMGFNQVFVITHQKEVEDSIPSQLTVVRHQEQGYSKFLD